MAGGRDQRTSTKAVLRRPAGWLCTNHVALAFRTSVKESIRSETLFTWISWPTCSACGMPLETSARSRRSHKTRQVRKLHWAWFPNPSGRHGWGQVDVFLIGWNLPPTTGHAYLVQGQGSLDVTLKHQPSKGTHFRVPKRAIFWSVLMFKLPSSGFSSKGRQRTLPKTGCVGATLRSVLFARSLWRPRS